MILIDPLKVFGNSLNSIQSPSRYLGGEAGIIKKPFVENDSLFNFAVAFPELYEIAMSNLAVKIIYNGLNSYSNIRCERVFAPAKDYEDLLKSRNIPLHTLESGIPLKDTDMIGFSIGYELGITEVLAMLDDSGIPLKASDRTEEDPIVLCGGCGVTNPLPFSDFFDVVFIGEAEDALFETVNQLAELKKQGKKRQDLLDFLKAKSFIWVKGKKARRVVQNNFGLVPSIPSWYPLPTNRPVQDHGVIEIMRGCPNGCRFCHAGIYYRPMRVKNLKLIIDEIDHLVFDAGYREISLNSLSSADFPDVSGLLDILDERYKGYNVSFQLPSLKVNSMSLDILEKISRVRKSGLTFAIETPEEMWQLSLNKEVYAQHLEEIIKEAKARGWSSAKFYFMIGLPLGEYFGEKEGQISEEKAIVDFMLRLQGRTRIQCNVNVGVFIPKPHTAYERMRQITPEKAKEKIDYIYQNLPKGKFKIGRHNFDATVLEGLLSRGDERAGDVILGAYKKGARFDAWDEHLRENAPLWYEAFDEASYDVKEWIYHDFENDESLPWNEISLGPSPSFYKKEWENSKNNVLTPKCQSDCDHKCGICNSKEDVKVYTKELVDGIASISELKKIPEQKIMPESNIPVLYRVLFSFTRKDGGQFTPYLSQVEIFHKAFLRTGIQFVFTTGFNPLPRLEFATAMTLGIASEEEIASCLLYDNMDEKELVEKLNNALPENLSVTKAYIFPVTNLRKRESLSQCLWGGVYQYQFYNKEEMDSILNNETVKNVLSKEGYKFKIDNMTMELVTPVSDKTFRKACEEVTGKQWYDLYDARKTKTLAKNVIQGWTAADEEKWRVDNKNFKKTSDAINSSEPVDFFDFFKQIAKINEDLMVKHKELNELQKEIMGK